MKRIFCLVLSILSLFMLCSCGSSNANNRVGSNTTTVQDVLDSQEAKISQEDLANIEVSDELREKMSELYNLEQKNEEEELNKNINVDVDLTTLSSTMVYSEVYNMLVNPSEYVGKVVKMQGIYSPQYVEDTKTTYHMLIIQDATACCAQGLEFLLKNNKYPNNAEGQEFTVIGTFSTYLENGQYFVTLKDSIIV